MRNSVQLSVRQLIMQAGFVILVSTAMILGAAVPAAAQEGSKSGDWIRGIFGASGRLPSGTSRRGCCPVRRSHLLAMVQRSTKASIWRNILGRDARIGLTRQMLSNSLSMFVQDPKLQMMVVLHEDFNRWRAIYMDGRGHPKEVTISRSLSDIQSATGRATRSSWIR